MIASLANHLWQSTLVAFVAWLVASLKFLVPFAALTSLETRAGWHLFARDLSRLVGRIVVDKTDLKGTSTCRSPMRQIRA